MVATIHNKKNGVTIEVVEQINHVIDAWNEINEDNLFLQLNYLHAIKETLPEGVVLHYAIGKRNKRIEFITACQLYTFNASHINDVQQSICNWCDIKSIGRILLAKTIINYLNCTKCTILIFGNVLQTGNKHYAVAQSVNVDEYICALADYYKKEKKTDAFVVKDNNDVILPKAINFYTQPNMVLNIRPNWKQFEDYVHDLTPKYKKRLNNTMNKNGALLIRPMDSNTILAEQDVLYNLYLNVYNESSTKIGFVTKDYFYKLSKELKEQFKMIGFYLENNLVAFAVCLFQGKVLEANFIGFDYSLNKKLKLYQTILYNYVKEAIQHGCNQLSLGRTGLEIKSTIGAEPTFLNCSLLPLNKQMTVLIKPILKNIKKEKFEQRHPFKYTNNRS